MLGTLHLESLSVFSEVLLNYGVESSVEQPPKNPADSSPHFLLSGFGLKKVPRPGDGLLLSPWWSFEASRMRLRVLGRATINKALSALRGNIACCLADGPDGGGKLPPGRIRGQCKGVRPSHWPGPLRGRDTGPDGLLQRRHETGRVSGCGPHRCGCAWARPTSSRAPTPV